MEFRYWIIVLIGFVIGMNVIASKVINMQGKRMLDELSELPEDYMNMNREQAARASRLHRELVRWLKTMNDHVLCQITMIGAMVVLGALTAVASKYGSSWTTGQSVLMLVSWYVTTCTYGLAVLRYYRCRWARRYAKLGREGIEANKKEDV